MSRKTEYQRLDFNLNLDSFENKLGTVSSKNLLNVNFEHNKITEMHLFDYEKVRNEFCHRVYDSGLRIKNCNVT